MQFAMLSKGDPSSELVLPAERIELKDRRSCEGVGIPEGILEWILEEKSIRAAACVVRGR